YLRGQVGFKGVVFSDDLEMGAVTEACPIGEASVRTAAAGHDLLLVCHTEAAQRTSAAALVDAYRASRLPRRALEQAVERIRRLRERRRERFEGGPPASEPDGAPLAWAIATRAVTRVAPGRPDFTHALNGRVAVVFPRDPYDAALLAPGVLGLTAYGWRKCQIDAVIARLSHP